MGTRDQRRIIRCIVIFNFAEVFPHQESAKESHGDCKQNESWVPYKREGTARRGPHNSSTQSTAQLLLFLLIFHSMTYNGTSPQWQSGKAYVVDNHCSVWIQSAKKAYAYLCLQDRKCIATSSVKSPLTFVLDTSGTSNQASFSSACIHKLDANTCPAGSEWQHLLESLPKWTSPVSLGAAQRLAARACTHSSRRTSVSSSLLASSL
jgi:hypothetical protein